MPFGRAASTRMTSYSAALPASCRSSLQRLLAGQADLARTVDLEDLDVDLVAFLEDVGHLADALVGELRDVHAGRRCPGRSRRRRRSRRSCWTVPLVDLADLGLGGDAADAVDAPSASRRRRPRRCRPCRRPRRRSCTPVSSTMPRIILPPGPMRSRILSGLILSVMMRGAYGEMLAARRRRASSPSSPRMCSRPSRAWSSACAHDLARRRRRS